MPVNSEPTDSGTSTHHASGRTTRSIARTTCTSELVIPTMAKVKNVRTAPSHPTELLT